MYASIDVLLLTSATEGMPGVMIEAAMSGVPVVATDVGAVRWLFDNGVRGEPVPVDATAQEYSEAIVRTAKMPSVTDADVPDACTWATVVEQWVPILDRVSAGIEASGCGVNSITRLGRRFSPRHRRWQRLLDSCIIDPDALSRPLESPGPRDVMICGHSRSGTALVTAALWQPPAMVTVMEPWDAFRLAPADLFRSFRTEMTETGALTRGRLDIDALERRRIVRWQRDGERTFEVSFDDQTTLAIKMPAFWRYLDLLPETRFIVCLRDPLEVISSYERVGGRLAEGLDYDIPFNREMNESAPRFDRRCLLPSHRHVRLRGGAAHPASRPFERPRRALRGLEQRIPRPSWPHWARSSASNSGRCLSTSVRARLRPLTDVRHASWPSSAARPEHSGTTPAGWFDRTDETTSTSPVGEGETRVKGAKSLAVSVLGTRPVSAAVELVLRGRLRVVAYHGVPDAESFRRQLDLVVSRYQTVSGAEVVAATNGGPPLPERAVWITFDDGHSNVVDTRSPVAPRTRDGRDDVRVPGARGRRCGPLVGGDRVRRRPAGGLLTCCRAASTWRRSRRCPTVNGEVTSRMRLPSRNTQPEGTRHPTPVAGMKQLESWMSAGMELGNHTWDHPCLDRCTADEQRRQIAEADRWLEGLGAFERCRLFAYPNGDWTPDSERFLEELGYDIALLFDHRLADVARTNPLRVSRVRLDTAAPVERARAILSGGHSMVYRPAPIAATSGDAA